MIVTLIFALWLAQTAASTPQLDDVRAALDENDVRKAETLLSEIIRAKPQSAEAHHLLGVIRFAEGRHSEAEQSLKKSVELNPKLVPAYLTLGDIYAAKGDRQALAQILERGLKENPAHPFLQQAAAVSAAEAGDLQAALRYLKAIPEAHAPPGYWEVLGRTLLSLGQWQEAEKAYARTFEEQPESVSALRALAGIALKQGDTEKAWHHMAQARKLAPDSPEVLYEFGQVSVVNNLIAEAVAVFRLLLIMEPDNPRFILGLGNALMDNASYADAETHLARYVAMLPSEPVGRVTYGIALLANKKNEAAAEQLQTAIRLSPDLAEPYYHLGMIAFNANDDQQAERLFFETLKRDEHHGLAQLVLGRVYMRARKNEEAVEWLERAAQTRPSDPNVFFQLSRAYALAGRRDRAQEVLKIYNQLSVEKDKRDSESRRYRYTNPSR
jgi:predicted Zn-dependent protease